MASDPSPSASRLTALYGCVTQPLAHCLSFVTLSQLLTTRGVLITSIVFVLAVRYATSPWRKVPPGPRGLPFLGNSPELQDKRWMFQKECKRKFEHIMYLNALGQPIVVLNSFKAAFELLDRRANIYSDRPRFIVAHEILCGGLFTAFMRFGDVWRRTRRAAHEVLTKVMVRDYHPIFRKEASLLASAMIKSPDALQSHIQRSSASALLTILYDNPTLENKRDKTIAEIHAFTDRLSTAAAPGAHLVELFPWMIHIPERFARWKREGMEHYRRDTAMFTGLMDPVINGIANGSKRPSVCSSLIKDSDRSKLSNHEIAWLAGTLFTAGAKTTGTTLSWWVLAMIANPDIQRRAQDELDAIVGRSRAPTFSDAPSLPYIQALVKETLRWRPSVPLGVPHATTEDDWYEGMFIPKGTICISNLWQCNHDPAYYGDDAASFKPERFLDGNGGLISGPVEARGDGHSTFGIGRRFCVGNHSANDALFISIATLLWATRLERARDASGKEVPLDTETLVDTGLVFYPLPYTCKITPRFPDVPSILAAEIKSLKA
ncbi:cytochrome P450 [Russula brevipes]|nr:cytochrome P450 [Russula brevipes]